MKTFKTLVVSSAALAALLSGCSEVTNKGGDTSCKDFTAAEQQKQNDAINKMIKDQRGSEPSNLELTATKMAVQTYCQTVGKQDTQIKEAPHA